MILVIAGSVMLLSSCQQTRDVRFSPSASLVPTTITPFSAYQQAVATWLSGHRQATGPDKRWEVQINTPFECGVGNTKGVFFIHGLGDSPYFFQDVAQRLCDQGVWVRAILLPGHGSKPGDMLNASYELWQQATNFHVDEFSREVDALYLAGFSTGTNLAVVAAGQRNDINGLLLFSPAFESRFAVTWLAPYLTGVFSWPNVEPEDNPTRYNSMAMQGFAAYQKSVDAVQVSLHQQLVSVPALLVVPEGDSVVDVNTVAELYTVHFRHPKSELLWLGEEEGAPADSQVLSMKIPAQRIYGKVSNSLAIVTNYSALKKSFGADKNFKLHAGVVNYIDYENEGFKLPITSARFGRVLTKERAYGDERELRIFFEDHGMVNDLIDTTVAFDYFPSEELIKD